MLEFMSVSRSAGREAVFQQANLTFSPETPTALLGLSPGGRKAALRLIGGADRPDAGSILFNGKERQRQKDGGMRFTWIGREGVAASGRGVGKALRGASAGKPGEAELARLLGQVGLAGKLDVRTQDLDLAERLRLAIGCALAARRPAILLDAPFQDLPAEERTALLGDLPGMLAGAGAIVVLAAGAPDEALALGGQTAILSRGRVVQVGSTREVFAHPRDLRAALATAHPFLNTLTVTLAGGVCRLADGSTFHAPDGLDLPSAGRCTLAFRPDDLGFARHNDHAVRFAARADGEETISGGRFVRAKFADAVWFAAHVGVAAAPGMVLNLFVDVDRVMAFDEAGLAVGGPQSRQSLQG
jgi:glycerol transport system ATP-binding protein